MMGDPVWFVLFKTDISNHACIKGTVMVKELIADIQDMSIDKQEAKRLNIVLKTHKNKLAHIMMTFEMPQKAIETRDYLQFNRNQTG